MYKSIFVLNQQFVQYNECYKQKQSHIVSLPFYGVFMLKYRYSLRKIVKKYFPGANVSFVFPVPCCLNRFFI